MVENNKNHSFESFDDEIKIKPFFNTLKRGKFFIILLTSISSLYSIYYSGKIKPTYKGSFEILVTNSGSAGTKSINSSLEGLLNISGGQFNNSKTQELILKSPSVLQPVFNFVVDEYSKRGIDTESLNYKEWLESEIEIKFKKSSQVLEVIHTNNDKTLIGDVLNKISKRYQDFSKSAREKELQKSIVYLKEQKNLYEKKSLDAIKKLNNFSIENGLGDIDGFVTLSKNSVQDDKTDKAGQRFQNQFKLLEIYETRYTDYSSKLKKNSKVLQELALKVENLRSSLKRPNEILIKYRELQRDSFNKDRLFNSIQSQLLAIQFEKAKQQDPWELISKPTVDKKKVAPNRLNISILFFLSSFFLGCIITLIHEKVRGNLFELEDIKKVIDCEYLETLFLNEKELSSIMFENSIKSLNINLKSKNCIFILTKKNFMNLKFFIQELAKSNHLEIMDKVNFNDINNLKSFENLFFLVEPGQFTTREFSIISKYMKANKDKLKGWFLILNKP